MVGDLCFPESSVLDTLALSMFCHQQSIKKNVTFFDSLRQVSQCMYKQESDDGLDHLYLVNLDPFFDLVVCFSVDHRSFWSNNKLPYGARK